MKKVLIIIFSTVVVVQLFIFIILNFIGDKVMDEMIESEFNELDEYVDNGYNNALKENKNQNTDNSENGNKKDGKINDNVKNDNGNIKESNEMALNVDNNVVNTDEETAEIDMEKLKRIKDRISNVDKVRVASIVIRKFSIGEVNEVKGMLSNGISSNEKKKIKKIVFENLNNNEVSEIKNMYNKYSN